jgi:hypothetical protein
MQKVHLLALDAIPSRTIWQGQERSHDFKVYVPYTTSDLTSVALKDAAAFKQSLGFQLSLIAVQVVPFPLPLDRPLISMSFFEQELEVLASNIDAPLDTHVVIERDRGTVRKSHFAWLLGDRCYKETLVANPAKETCTVAGAHRVQCGAARGLKRMEDAGFDARFDRCVLFRRELGLR